MNDAIDDFELLQRWVRDDKKAANDLLDRHFRTLHRFFINKAAERDIHDLIQDTMKACAKSIASFRHDAAFKTFLLSIARNILLHHYRRHRRKEALLDPLTEGTNSFIEAAGISSLLARRREQELILAALRTIAFNHQVVLELHFWEGLSAHECALVLDVPDSTIKGRLHRAKLALKTALETGTGTPAEKRSITSAMASWILGIQDHIRQGSPEAARIVAAWDNADHDPGG